MRQLVSAVLLLIVSSTATQASTLDQWCQKRKSSLASKFATCLFRAQSKGMSDSGALDSAVASCADILASKWSKAQQVASAMGATCRSSDDQATVSSLLVSCSNSVAQVVDGNPLGVDPFACPQQLNACSADQHACTDDLHGCGVALSECQAHGHQCDGDLGICQTAAHGCADELHGCGVALSECQAHGGDCDEDLGQCQDDLGECHGDLAACTENADQCAASLDACRATSHALLTGQTVVWAAGDDASVHGQGLSYTDNHDGTITDNTTGLMWEKKVGLDGTSSHANLHDADNAYSWAGNCTNETGCGLPTIGTGTPAQIAASPRGVCCQSNADCQPGNSCTFVTNAGDNVSIFGFVRLLNDQHFAGYSDWRVPNERELLSLIDYSKPAPPLIFSGVHPPVDVAFYGASCGPTCTDLADPACSCTRLAGPGIYASSTTSATLFGSGQLQYWWNHWSVSFYDGTSSTVWKGSGRYIRAVRGGAH